MKIKIYEYKNCSTCQKAVKFLQAHEVEFEKIPIVDQPPTVSELKKMATYLKEAGGSVKQLFNVSGEQYRQLNMAKKLAEGMSDESIFALLAGNGKLIKRPFLLTGSGGTVGFKADVWEKLLT